MKSSSASSRSRPVNERFASVHNCKVKVELNRMPGSMKNVRRGHHQKPAQVPRSCTETPLNAPDYQTSKSSLYVLRCSC